MMIMFAKKLVKCAFVLAFGVLGTACSGVPTARPAVTSGGGSVALVQDDLAATRAELAARRATQIERFHAYAQAGVFPKNRVMPVMANIFRDEDGHLCAVANLVHLDGHDDLVDHAARTNNFVRVAQVPEGPLHDWVLTSGLTNEEIAVIQEPYMPAVPTADFDQAERARLQTKFAEIEKKLVASHEASLDTAVARLAASRRMDHAAVAHMEPSGEPRQFATPPGA
jgi:hypothetical protein